MYIYIYIYIYISIYPFVVMPAHLHTCANGTWHFQGSPKWLIWEWPQTSRGSGRLRGWVMIRAPSEPLRATRRTHAPGRLRVGRRSRPSPWVRAHARLRRCRTLAHQRSVVSGRTLLTDRSKIPFLTWIGVFEFPIGDWEFKRGKQIKTVGFGAVTTSCTISCHVLRWCTTYI